MVQDLVEQLTPEERASYLASGGTYPFPTRVLVRSIDVNADPDLVPGLEGLFREAGQAANRQAGEELQGLILEKLARSDRPEARAVVRRIALSEPRLIGSVVRGLGRDVDAEDLPILVAALDSNDPGVLAAVAGAASRLRANPDGPEPLRNLIRASGRSSEGMAGPLANLARKWYGVETGGSGAETLARAEAAYRERFPSGPALEDASTTVDHDYTLAGLLAEVVRPGLVAEGSPERGREILNRARCLDCHKLGVEGAGLGPDLTTLSSRFRPEDVLESIVEPSKVISDQYRSITVATADGQVYNGMPAGGDDETLILLLSDGTKINIPKSEVEEQATSEVSVMPAGLIDALDPAEIADLLALFEAQPRVEADAEASPTVPPERD